jgi:D-3-phosphoglycerate dehydrogenase
VPETAETQDMIREREIRLMKPGACFINNSRGTIVDLSALAAALEDKHLSGAAVDVFPTEPSSNSERFVSPLQGLDNVILTPHVGGSTEEAQERIGAEVARKFVDYSDNGSTTGAVNFPQVLLPPRSSGTRYIHVHRNEPGGLGRLNEAFAQRGVNIAAQYCQTDSEIGYVVLDVEGGVQDAAGLLADIRRIPGTICARLCLSRSTSRTFLISTLASAVWLRPRSMQRGGSDSSSAGNGKAQSARVLETALKSAAERNRTRPERAPAKTVASRSKPPSTD